MTLYLKKHKLTYVSVPKCACTSLKQFFFEVHNGFEFKAFDINGQAYGIHKLARSIPFEDLDRKMTRRNRTITVVREPVGRLVSCYANKVIDARLLEKPKAAQFLEQRGLTTTPTIQEFVRDLPAYQESSYTLLHHSRPLSYFLGRDPAFFDKIFPLRELSTLVEYVADMVGEAPSLPHTQKSTSSDVSKQLTEEDRARIEEIYAEDREIFGQWMK
ncbi:sulfotransferase family 2 domain-containing protein [Tropicimonas sediminicola]|uniref:Sulfotransferase family protein n=1 Tax=Tropicimonas sediminicola TaxID=1031541 RepID=A0A239I2V2_9RHOB|nr:sulfotransferase family 2 domain-containing protein [Tropicimonas sediminicola]SNS87821.1 Sulfotransferase family protein [Tropicimonas sediminicola]